MRILLVKLSSFGDVVHTFPALTDLRAARPEVEVDWLVEEGFAGLAAAHPAVALVFPVALRRLRGSPATWPRLAVELSSLRRRLRERRYDLVVDAQGLLKSAFLARLAGAPVAGLDGQSAREPMASRLYARRIAVDRSLHAVERTRRLFAAALSYPLPEAEGRFGLRLPSLAAEAARTLALPARYGLLLHSASWPTKLWPEEHWRMLAAWLGSNGGSAVLPWGSEEERRRAERIAAGAAGLAVLPRRLAGEELLAVLGRADWAAGLDSGLMHLAAALGVPGLWLYGPTDPKLTGPYGPGQMVLRSPYRLAPCRRRTCEEEPGGLCCMQAIGPEAVTLALGEIVAERGAASPVSR